MSRSSLFWILLVLWFILGWWLCKKFICGSSASTTAAAAAPIIATDDKCDMSLLMEDGTFKSSSDRNLRFPKSSFENIAYGTQTQSALQSTADYLAGNASRSLIITGRYAGDESYNGILPNLGMARATTIKSILTSMGAPAGQIDVRGNESTDICYSQNAAGNLTGSGNEYDEIAGTGIPMASLLANGSGAANLDANGSGGGAGGGSATDNASGAGEASTANLGAGGGSGGGSVLGNSIGYAFGDTDSGDARLAQIKERLFGKPITLYFETNSDRLTLSAQQRQDFADLSYYLDKVTSANLSVGGHTDSRGDENYNRRLSRDRAKFVQNYIEKNTGIQTSRFTAQGYGHKNPISTNETSEGRAKNRRVEVILK